LEERLLVLEKREFFGWLASSCGHKATVFEVFSDDEHDESADRAVTIFATWVDFVNATQMLDQALSTQQDLRIFRKELLR